MMVKNLARSGFILGIRGLVPLSLVLGLLMAPVTCTCGAAIPHGHSLFQLPHHNHAAPDHSHDHDAGDHDHRSGSAEALHIHPLATFMPHKVDECDEMGHHHPGLIAATNFALSNALEQHDGWTLKAPPSSSFGQPTVMTQPSLIDRIAAQQCDSIDLPATRMLVGMVTTPEPPPPRI
jgi:hypothetical protein